MAETITSGEGYQFDEENNKYTVYLKHGDTVTLENIPVGVSYTVKETYAPYTPNKTNGQATGTITTTASTEEFINELKNEIDTGIILQYAPYIAILAVVLAGAALLIIRRRRNNED